MASNDIFDKRWMYDIDESLLELIPEFLVLANRKYPRRDGKMITKKEVFTYDLWKVLNIKEEEAVDLVLEFYSTSQASNLPEMKGAGELLKRVNGNGVAITARPSCTREITDYNLSLRFGAYSPRVIFSKSYSPLIPSEGIFTKSELCKIEKVEYALEDSSFHARSLANAGISVFLINQPWNINDNLSHPNIKRINSISDILG